ncbi:hypothetical protein Goarm_000566, partial [Gossypium armourianum]|nr:hypothetical protein [Gossypium armourianum]
MEISPNTGGDENFLEANSGEGSQDDVDRNTKKVQFKEANKDVDTDMLYLTIQPWTKDFNPQQPYPSMVMAWIQLLGLLGFLYKRRVLEEISGTIGKLMEFSRVEYESLPTIYFKYENYGHTKNIYALQKQSSTVEKERTKSTSNEGLGSRFAVMCRLQILEGLEVDMTNVAPREVAGNKGKIKGKKWLIQ